MRSKTSQYNEHLLHINDNKMDLPNTYKTHHSGRLQNNISSGTVTKNEQLNQTQRLFQAIQHGDLEILSAFLSENSLNNIHDTNVATMALKEAIAMKSCAMTRMLLGTNCHVNKVDNEGRTPLHDAIICGAEECTALLLQDPHINVNIQDNQGWTPLFWAVSKGQIEIVHRLLDLKCDVHSRDLAGNYVLHEAAEIGKLGLVQILIKYGLDVNCMNFSGETPLLLACIEGHESVVNWLINAGADVNVRSDVGASALIYSALCGNSHIAKLLLEANANMNNTDTEGSSPLILASRYGHIRIVELLLKHGSKNCDVSLKDAVCRSALHAAAENNHSDIIEALLLHNSDASLADNMGKTALSIAAQNGFIESLIPLAKTKVGIDIADHIGMRPIHWAVVGGHSECVRQLLTYGSNANSPNGGIANTPLILAVDCGHVDIVTLLLQSDCNVNAVNTNGRSALHEAAQRGSCDMMELLVTAGAYVNMQSSKGDTPLIVATRLGHAGSVKFLLEVNCDVKLANSNHTTALHEASLWGHSIVAKMLLDYGADINRCESEGDSPLILACTKGHLEVVELLLKHGCDVNHSNEMQHTALLEAAEHGYNQITQTLIDHKANITAVDTEEDSALTLAASKGHVEVVRTLLHAGIDTKHVNRWGRNALHEACSLWTGPSDTVGVLLQTGMDPDLPDSVNNTPLILATMSGHEEAVYQLIRANCDINKAGETMGKLIKPIQVAVTREAFNIARMLFLAGANMNSVNIWMDSPTGPVYSVPVKNNEMKEWLKHITQTPVPLKFLCRICIRQALSIGFIIEEEVKYLPLPNALCEFMLMNDAKYLLNDNILPSRDSFVNADSDTDDNIAFS